MGVAYYQEGEIDDDITEKLEDGDQMCTEERRSVAETKCWAVIWASRDSGGTRRQQNPITGSNRILNMCWALLRPPMVTSAGSLESTEDPQTGAASA